MRFASQVSTRLLSVDGCPTGLVLDSQCQVRQVSAIYIAGIASQREIRSEAVCGLLDIAGRVAWTASDVLCCHQGSTGEHAVHTDGPHVDCG